VQQFLFHQRKKGRENRDNRKKGKLFSLAIDQTLPGIGFWAYI
jgi:hypothetical protein